MHGVKSLMQQVGVSQRHLAGASGVSPAAINNIINRGQWPKRESEAVRHAIHAFFVGAGVDEATVLRALEATGSIALSPHAKNPVNREEEPFMIMRKQTLSPETRQHFGLVRNPFAEPQKPEDVFLSKQLRYVREVMYDAAVNGNFLAVVGQSGAGKSVLRKELLERLMINSEDVLVIEPYVLAMTESEKQGKALRANHIAEAIITTLSPHIKIKSGPETRFRQLHDLLKESSRTGHKHCLIIEEAHDLNLHTLKHLKRFLELEDGMKRLLSIILIGQTELKEKLTINSPGIREVVQRVDVVEIPPVACEEFLQHRFDCAGADLLAIWDREAVFELQKRLEVSHDAKGNGVYVGYPLAVSNFASAAMNLAMQVGESRVSVDIVRQVRA